MERKKKKLSLEECFDELASSEQFTTYEAILTRYNLQSKDSGQKDSKQKNTDDTEYVKLRQWKKRLQDRLESKEDGRSVKFRYKPDCRYALTRGQQEDKERHLKNSQGPDASRLFLTDGLSLLMEGQHAREPIFQLEEVGGLRNGGLITQTKLERYLGKNIIQFKYMEQFQTEVVITFSPAFLKEYNSRWNIVGFLHDLDHPDVAPRPAHIPIDRIVPNGIDKEKQITFKRYTGKEAEQQLGQKFKKADPGFFEERYKDVVGMTVSEDRETETIVIKALNKKDYMYLKTKPLHPSQQEVVRDRHGGLFPCPDQQKDHLDDRTEWLFTIRVKWNYELMSKILGFGAGLVVEGEGGFEERIKSEIAKMATNYGLEASVTG